MHLEACSVRRQHSKCWKDSHDMKENWALLFAMYRWGKLREEIKVDQDGDSGRTYDVNEKGFQVLNKPETQRKHAMVQASKPSSI